MDYRDRYEEYLKSPQWAEKRKQKALQSNYMCEICGKVIPKGFHIHHLTYKHFGNEPLSDLQFLCEECHTNVHCGIQVHKANKKRPQTKPKDCSNCYYSQIMRYSGTKKSRRVLWCNKYERSCDKVCIYYRKGEQKKIKIKQKNKLKNKII